MSFLDSPSPPTKAICFGKAKWVLKNDEIVELWSVIANTPHGTIPGILFCDCFIHLNGLAFVYFRTIQYHDYTMIFICRVCNQR